MLEEFPRFYQTPNQTLPPPNWANWADWMLVPGILESHRVDRSIQGLHLFGLRPERPRRRHQFPNHLGYFDGVVPRSSLGGDLGDLSQELILGNP
jgi:hypothetical protein